MATEATLTGAGAAMVPLAVAASGADWKVALIGVLGSLATVIVSGVFNMRRDREYRDRGR